MAVQIKCQNCGRLAPVFAVSEFKAQVWTCPCGSDQFRTEFDNMSMFNKPESAPQRGRGLQQYQELENQLQCARQNARDAMSDRIETQQALDRARARIQSAEQTTARYKLEAVAAKRALLRLEAMCDEEDTDLRDIKLAIRCALAGGLE